MSMIRTSALRSGVFNLLRYRASILPLVWGLLWMAWMFNSGSPLQAADNLVLSEFMASNTSGIVDEDGDSSDWMEIYNPGSSPVNTLGWRLTDLVSDKSKWLFPATNIPPNGFLLVWASGKDRRNAGSPLHANFSLSSSGEYLALVRPDESLATEFNPYPKQFDNISYGVVQQLDVSQFIKTNSSVRVYVPSNNTLGLTWTTTGFSDSGWLAGVNGVGYEQSVPGFAVKNYKANVVVGSLAAADAVIATPAQQSNVYSENRGVVNYMNSGGGANYGNDSPFPGFDFSVDQDDFVIEATGVVTIPAAGNWTFGVNSDDGFRLQIGSFTMSYPDPRGPGDTLSTFNFPSAGDYNLRLVFYERGGGSELELYAAQGSFVGWNSTNFRLVGDTGNQGLAVRSLPIGQTAGLKQLIQTDLLSTLYNKNASAYLRYSFNVSNPGALTTLSLLAKYDDGFVAYLNGTKVLDRNAPASPTYNSAATALHANSDAQVYETLDLTPFRGNLVSGNNVLAVQLLNLAANNEDALFLAELSEYRTTLLSNDYFTVSTPASYNGTNIYRKVGDTHFSHSRGFYETNFSLTITCETPGAVIRYTLDGTEPTATSGTVYTTPVAISKTTTVRAAAFKSGFTASNVDTQTYLYTRDIITQSPTGTPPPGWPSSWGANVVDYGMDPDIVNNAPWKNTITNDLKSLPTFSIVMNLSNLFDSATGIYANPYNDTIQWERPCSLELIRPDGKQGFHENCGIRVRGGFSRSTDNPKHAFRIFFRQEYGAPKLNYPVFGDQGAKSFDKFDLRTTQNYSWAFQGDPNSIFLRDQSSRDTQIAMGQLGERGDWYHLYINGVYWGLYNTDERAEAAFGESYVGGRAEDYDTIKVGPDQGYTIYATDGNLDAWFQLWQAATNGFASDTAYFKVQGLNPDGTANPSYTNLVDVPNLIDYMLVIIFGGNLDAPISNFLGNSSPNNWFGIRDRTGEHGGFRFISHDAEHTLLNVAENRTGPFPAGDPTQGSSFEKSSPQYIFTRMWANAEFRILCADRIQKHFFNGGALSAGAIQARLDKRTNEIFNALVPESARWGDSKRGAGAPITRDDWLLAYNNVRNTYLPARGNIVISQLQSHGLYPSLKAPTFSTFGGFVAFGYNLILTNPNATGTIYYTLDGSDPRLRGGAINPTALAYSAPIELNTARTVRARVKDGATWSAIVEATFYPQQVFDGLAITEIMYNPPGDGVNLGDEYEFLELKNTTANPIDLSGLAFTAGIDYTFPNGTKLGAQQFYVLARNATVFAQRYPGVQVKGVYTGKLDNNGETIRLKHVLGGTVFTVAYSDQLPWPVTADGHGFSLVPLNPNPTSNSDSGKQWRASTQRFGSPGADDPSPVLPPILVNEALTHTDLPDVDAIELYNPTESTAPIGGWFLSDDASVLTKFRIPDGKTIPAHGYVVFTEADFNKDPLDTNSFRLSSVGDQIYLSSGDAQGNLTGYGHGFEFGASQNGVTFGRYVNSQGEEHFPSQISRTLGSANSGPRIGPVVISEIHYHPALGFDEFVELQNITSTNVPLYDPNAITNTWKLSGLSFTFPQGVSVPPGGFIILSPIDPAAFRTKYSVPAAAQIFGPVSGSLQDSGERLELTRPDSPNTNLVPYIVVDAVRYNDKLPWPIDADGSGPSLQRLIANAYGDDPTNWFASGITPGKANVPNSPPSVTILSPADGSRFVPPTSVVIDVSASDPDSGVGKVEFYIDGAKVGEDSSAPYSYTWTDPTPGVHTVTAKAIDNALAIGTSDPVQITVVTPTPVTVVSKGSSWKYLDNGTYPGATWTAIGFNDNAWSSGPGQLGYGDSDEATVVGFGPDSNNKYITTWFRRTFALSDVSRYLSLNLSVLRDDGAVVYLNGTEIFRSNMPDGTIVPSTLASTTVGVPDEAVYYNTSVSPSLLQEGNNTLAVEIHQSSGTSSDISFDLELTGTLAPQAPTIQLTSPANNFTYVAPATVSFAATASDPDLGITRVEFYQGSTKVGEDAAPPYLFDWTGVGAGSYTLRAVAINGIGLSRTSAPVAISVQANQAPTVSIASPTEGSVFTQPASLPITVNAADPDGSVTNVLFKVDGVTLGQDTASPFNFTWNNPSIGDHVLTAVATDSRGASVTSIPIHVSIAKLASDPFTFVSLGTVWRYHDLGQDLGTSWRATGYNDSGWSNGLAQLGYSPDENDEATKLNFGPDSEHKYPTYYFRRTFSVLDPSTITDLQLRFLRDDGLVAYLNGVEIVRDNMPAGTIQYSTFAVNAINGTAESALTTNAISPSLLVAGLNVLAVEVHQQSTNSSDLSFDAELYGTGQQIGPTISAQPIQTEALIGSSSFLAVSAAGSLPLSFQWRKGPNAINGATSPVLNFATVKDTDAGDYTVIVSNGAGSITSQVAKLTTKAVIVPPGISSQPSDIAIVEGENAQFQVIATGTDPLSYQWRREGVPISGANSSELILTGVTASQAGAFDVVISNSGGTTNSRPAQLVVYQKPVILQRPTGTIVIAGETATFKVIATGTTPLQYQWFRNNQPISNATNDTYSIVNAQPADQGDFNVSVSNIAGTATSILVSLFVRVPPHITLQPSNQSSSEGSNVVFHADAIGDPVLQFQWFFNNAPISGATAKDLQIGNVKTNNAGSYFLVVSNAYGVAVSDPALLNVASANVDTDGDGMPDWWEDLYQLNKLSAADADEDPDHDGQTNLQEFLAGTNPRDPTSVLRLIVARDGNQVLLTFQTAPALSYTIQYKDDVPGGAWKNLVQVPAQAVARIYETHDSLGGTRRFYRIVTPAAP